MGIKKNKNSPIKLTAKEKRNIAIIGSGVVGKATGKGFMDMGHDVVFADINTILVNQLSKEKLTAYEMGNNHLFDEDIYIVSVLTPFMNDSIELRFIESAAASLGNILKQNKKWPVIIIRSTVPPGTIEEIIIPLIEHFSGKKVDEDFGVVMNPEFLREVSAEKDFLNPWVVVIGSNNYRATKVIESLYKPFGAPIFAMSLKEAEMLKYVHNLYNANKISFFNEMRMVAESIGVDADKIFSAVTKSAEGIWNPTYGTRNFGPFGGTCLPKDTKVFLNWTHDKLKKKLPLLHATIKVNEELKEKEYLE